jgi:hypothetical protein
MAGSDSNTLRNTLRAVLKEQGWSRTRLVAELRREAARSGDTLPGTESLIAMASRWVNNHQQPSEFYRELLARTLGRPRVELFSDEAARLELAAEAEPWLLARVLEASSVGQAALEALEEAVGNFFRSFRVADRVDHQLIPSDQEMPVDRLPAELGLAVPCQSRCQSTSHHLTGLWQSGWIRPLT